MQDSEASYPRPYGQYTLLETIGQGGMSAIDLAHESVVDANYMRFLIIKRMHAHLTEEDQSYVRMFQDEARITQELRHAKIAQVYNFGNIGNEYYLAMEYVPGVNLRELQQALARKGKGLPIRISLKILVDILEALDYAHHRVDTFGQSMHIVHRDVNPRNVMLSIQGEVKLIDFGVAKAENRQDKTVGHAIKGKFAYMAPEQIDPKVGEVDGRTDLFAVALMLYELVAGRRAFHQLSEVQIMHRLLSGEIPVLPLAPDHPQPELLQSIYEKCISKSPEDRFATAGELAAALTDAAQYCQGLASEKELARFLQLNIGSKLNEITQRLNQYKEEHTGSISRPMPRIEPLSLDSSGTDFGTLHGNVDNHTYVPPAESPSHRTPNNTGFLVTGGIAIFALGIGGVLWFGSPSTPAPNPMKPTQVQTHSEKLPPVTKTTTATDTQDTTVKPPPSKQVKAPSETKPKDKVPNKETKPIVKTTTTTASKENTARSEKPSTDEQPQKDVSSTQAAQVVKSATEPTDTPPTLHSFTLMVGTEEGTRGLPVTLNGKVLTKTGSKKSVSLPEGKHTLTIIDPDSGLKYTQTITVTAGKSILTVRFPGL